MTLQFLYFKVLLLNFIFLFDAVSFLLDKPLMRLIGLSGSFNQGGAILDELFLDHEVRFPNRFFFLLESFFLPIVLIFLLFKGLVHFVEHSSFLQKFSCLRNCLKLDVIWKLEILKFTPHFDGDYCLKKVVIF